MTSRSKLSWFGIRQELVTRLVIASSAAAAHACMIDSCTYPDVRCEDGYAMTCYEGAWERMSCAGGTCKIFTTETQGVGPYRPYSRAVCTEDDAPDTRCPAPGQSFCDGNDIVECDNGYIVSRISCMTDLRIFPEYSFVQTPTQTGRQCVESGDLAACE